MEAEIEILVDEKDEKNHNHKKHEGDLVVEEADKDAYFGGKSLDAIEDGQDAIIRLNNIHKTYLLGLEGVPALRGITLNIKRGEFVCIYGTSGGGKTSMLNIIGTIDKPTKGELFINNKRVTFNTPDKVLADIRLKELGFVFQTFNLLSNLTALENVMMPLILEGKVGASERKRLAIEKLESVGMGDRLDHVPSQLSGGEQQRVTIARSLINSPSILLLDEPTGDLDTVNTAIVMKLLMEVNAKGTTLVMVTHDVGLKYFADRIIWLLDGKIQRVEHVSHVKRQETMEQLYEELESLGLGSSQTENGVQPAKKTPFALHNTQIRKPTDYRTHRGFNPETAPTMVNFSKVSQTN